MSAIAALVELKNRFQYHAPDEAKKLAHEKARFDAYTVAVNWHGELPDGREKALAITKLEEAMFWANAAIARNNG